MSAYILGTLGFVLYFIYDINSIKWNHPFLARFFGMGTFCLLISAVMVLGTALRSGEGNVCLRFFCMIGSIAFLILLVYTLFFALPFEETYLQPSQQRKAYTGKMYALCRHPGVLWFAGLYLCLWGASGVFSCGGYFVLMIVWNCLYVVFQDLWTFPRTFFNYMQYKEETPFLIPNRNSILACISDFKHERTENKGEWK